jgi:hypothetical protein
MADGRLPQINAEATPAVKAKLARLETQLSSEKARHYEIVGVLIKRATAKSIPGADIKKYREELKKARAKMGKSPPS